MWIRIPYFWYQIHQCIHPNKEMPLKLRNSFDSPILGCTNPNLTPLVKWAVCIFLGVSLSGDILEVLRYSKNTVNKRWQKITFFNQKGALCSPVNRSISFIGNKDEFVNLFYLCIFPTCWKKWYRDTIWSKTIMIFKQIEFN